jgi:hypothetical protein
MAQCERMSSEKDILHWTLKDQNDANKFKSYLAENSGIKIKEIVLRDYEELSSKTLMDGIIKIIKYTSSLHEILKYLVINLVFFSRRELIDTTIVHCSISAKNSCAVIKLSQSKYHIELIKILLDKNEFFFSSIEPVCYRWGFETQN